MRIEERTRSRLPRCQGSRKKGLADGRKAEATDLGRFFKFLCRSKARHERKAVSGVEEEMSPSVVTELS